MSNILEKIALLKANIFGLRTINGNVIGAQDPQAVTDIPVVVNATVLTTDLITYNIEGDFNVPSSTGGIINKTGVVLTSNNEYMENHIYLDSNGVTTVHPIAAILDSPPYYSKIYADSDYSKLYFYNSIHGVRIRAHDKLGSTYLLPASIDNTMLYPNNQHIVMTTSTDTLEINHFKPTDYITISISSPTTPFAGGGINIGSYLDINTNYISAFGLQWNPGNYTPGFGAIDKVTISCDFRNSYVLICIESRDSIDPVMIGHNTHIDKNTAFNDILNDVTIITNTYGERTEIEVKILPFIKIMKNAQLVEYISTDIPTTIPFMERNALNTTSYLWNINAQAGNSCECAEIASTRINRTYVFSNLANTNTIIEPSTLTIGLKYINPNIIVQEPLVSGTNIKTINGLAITGPGDLILGGDPDGWWSPTKDPHTTTKQVIINGGWHNTMPNWDYPNWSAGIIFGTNNTMSAYGVIIGDNNNINSGIVFGEANSESGNGGNNIILGVKNVIDSAYASLFGTLHYATGSNQALFGYGAVAKSDCKFIFGNYESFVPTTNVTNQVGFIALKCLSSDITPVLLLPNQYYNFNGIPKNFILVDLGTTMAFEGTIVGNISGGASVSFKIEGLVRCGATTDTCVLVGSTITPKFNDVSLDGCVIAISARPDINYLEILITGLVGLNISWNGYIHTNEVR